VVGKKLNHYEIVSRLGKGGMGEVYAADDTKLKRRVALKVLPAEVGSDPERRSSLEQEARAVAALNHPNIVTIYSIEEADGVPFLTMELIDGSTLTDTLEPGPLDRERFFDVATALADALSAAHERGITHRDLKPGNVMFTRDGRVKVLDFGIAKVWADPNVDAVHAETMTRDGIMRGTLAYMSPEQAQGQAIDRRSDIFSLGVVLYEMRTGRRPFIGASSAALASAILRDPPAEIDDAGPLEQLILRCLDKDPAARPQETADLRADLDKLRSEDVATGSPGARSIAVLPFADMSPQKDQDYFCEGIAEEIIIALAKVGDLRVASRMSSFQFKDVAGDSRKIGGKLAVDTLLEGSVRKAGDRVRITTQLVSVADGYHIWSERYDRELEDIFAVQDEIAQKVVEALELTLRPEEQRAMRRDKPANMEAYETYLQARQHFYRSGRGHNEVARQMFMRVTEIDPNFARAWAGIADACSYRHMYYGGGESADLTLAREASLKALEIDPMSAEAHAARGLALQVSGDLDDASREFQEAIRLDPKLFEAYYFYGRNYWAQGDLEEAARMFGKAAAICPEDHQSRVLLANVYRGLGRDDDAKASMRDALAVIECTVEAKPDDIRAIYHGAGALVYLGQTERALEWAQRCLAIDPHAPDVLYNVACAYAVAGKVDEAMHYLDRSIDCGFAHRQWIENDPDLKSLRDHVDYPALLTRLPPVIKRQ
jgi:non-specific serine/threonine protein kinase